MPWWGCAPHGCYGTTSWHIALPLPSPAGRSGLDSICFANLGAYAHSYRKAQNMALPARLLESAQETLARSFRVRATNAHGAYCCAECACAGVMLRSLALRAPGGSAPAPLRGAPPAKPGTPRACAWGRRKVVGTRTGKRRPGKQRPARRAGKRDRGNRQQRARNK